MGIGSEFRQLNDVREVAWFAVSIIALKASKNETRAFSNAPNTPRISKNLNSRTARASPITLRIFIFFLKDSEGQRRSDSAPAC